MKINEKITLFIVFAYTFMHSLILLKIIPFNIVWGGKLKSVQEMYFLEGFSLCVMLFLGIVILSKATILKTKISDRTLNILILIFAVFFIINTIGNLLADTIIEKTQALVTAYLAISLYTLSKNKYDEYSQP